MNAHARIPIPPSMSATLASRAVVVSLRISHWSGRRFDRQISDEVNHEHGADDDASRVNKLLLPKEEFAAVQKIVNATRKEFEKRTLPWIDGGGRIMNAAALMENDRWLSGQKRQFDAAVDEFIGRYPELVRNAPARMSGLFKEADYPPIEHLHQKYGMSLVKLPVPTPNDFRVSMSEAQADVIRAEIERTVREGAAAAARDVFRRVADVTGRMAERLTAYRPARGKTRAENTFRDSLVQNVRDLIEVLPSLNITGDPELTAMVERLRPLAAWDAQVLRENELVRRNVADEAQKILDQVAGFLA